MTQAEVHASGVALHRGTGQGTEFAVVHRPHHDDWSLPKGKLDPGETPPAAAVRETAEETGYGCVLGAALGEQRYPLPGSGRTKVVRYYAAQPTSGEFQPSGEVDELRWCTAAEARALLSYPRDADVLDRCVELGTGLRTLLLVRHAKAGTRADWDGDDNQRPLSDAGRRQAEALRTMLALWGPRTVHSATRLRCTETVAPLAADLGTTTVEEPLLSEEGYWPDREAGVHRLREIATSTPLSVVCSQGGVIPDVVTRLAEAGRVAIEEPVRSKKGSVWALHFRDAGILAASDYYPTALPDPS